MTRIVLLISFLVLGLVFMTGSPATAITLNLSTLDGAYLRFSSATVPYFEFIHSTSGYSFFISDSDGGSSLGFNGNISGQFNVTDIVTHQDGSQSAIVSARAGTPTLTINDGATDFTGKVAWLNLYSYSGTGVCNSEGVFNLSEVNYGGSDPDLRALRLGGIATVAFQFTASSLEDLTASGEDVSFNGTLSSVPVPATILLLGSGLIGLLALRRRQAQ